jgi:hypothetical protein
MIVEPLQLIVQTAFPGKTLGPGFSSADIAAAERRLKVTLPDALKDYLTVCGGSRDMMDASWRLFSPDQLRIDDGYLIFGTEDQGTMEYGIPVEELEMLDEEPHPTVLARAKNSQKWVSESGSISSYLLGVGSFQAVQSVGEQARFELPVKKLKDILKFLEPLGERAVQSGSHIVGFVDPRHFIVGTYLHNPETFWVGSSTDGALKEFAKRSGFELDWV